MADVIDLRQFRSTQLDQLLRAEAVEWQRELHWDYSSSLSLIRQYVDARVLPGFVLAAGPRFQSTAQGYGFFVYESRKGLIGDVYVHPDFRQPGRREEQRLLLHMIETLQATPGLGRIESQLMTFEPGELSPQFEESGFWPFRRLFMYLDLETMPAAVPIGRPTRDASVTVLGQARLEPWRGVGFDEAARLINLAYTGHLDSAINDQYRSFPGALRFLHNIVHYPGCGAFDEHASFVARAEDRQLVGLVLTSRVKDDVAHITQICVAPDYRGQGLGAALLGRTLMTLRQNQMSGATLTVTAANHGAVKLYQRIGFNTLREFDAWVWERRA